MVIELAGMGQMGWGVGVRVCWVGPSDNSSSGDSVVESTQCKGLYWLKATTPEVPTLQIVGLEDMMQHSAECRPPVLHCSQQVSLSIICDGSCVTILCSCAAVEESSMKLNFTFHGLASHTHGAQVIERKLGPLESKREEGAEPEFVSMS